MADYSSLTMVLLSTLYPIVSLVGNQIASLITNDLERHIFWCHLAFSFLAFILMWLVAQDPPVWGCQIMGCKTLGERKKTRNKEKSLVWLENPYLLRKKIYASFIQWCFSSLQRVKELTQRIKIWERHGPALDIIKLMELDLMENYFFKKFTWLAFT